MNDHGQEQAGAGLNGGFAADRAAITADIVCAYISNNSVRPSDLAGLIGSVHQALGSLGKPVAPIVEPVVMPTPAQIRKSINPDGMISFLDGKRYKSLKRHLTGQDFNPRTYRERFGLPSDYPMVSANYAAQRSALAKSSGLGQSRRTKAPKPAASSETSQQGERPLRADAAE